MWLEQVSNPGPLAHKSDALLKLPYLFDYMYMIILFNFFFLLQKCLQISISVSPNYATIFFFFFSSKSN